MKYKFLIFISVLLIASCAEDTDTIEPLPEEIVLIRPINDSIVNPCCTMFQWETDSTGEFRLTVSDDTGFTNKVVDTLITAKQFELEQTLQPLVKYYWRVRQGNTESSSSFIIRDLLSEFSGTFLVQIDRYCWGQTQCFLSDSTFMDTIELVNAGLNMRVKYTDDNINKLLGFITYRQEDNSVVYSNGTSIPTGCWLYINYTTDSFRVENNNGGIGGGTVWTMKGKK